MNIKKIIIVIIWSVFAFTVQAQYTNNPSATVHADQRIDKLVDLHIAYNQEFPIMDGYRIQLNMSSGNAALDNLNEIKAEFEEKYPEIKSYIIFREPYYRLRIGDFRTRLEAVAFLNRIKRDYPHAWVIKDKIEFPELTN
jgi:parvulin-like peptidyl-prolyl isomerase